MQVEKISQSDTFKAKVNRKFINDGEKFYDKRGLTVLYDRFRKQISKMEFYGEQNTVIKHAYNQREAKHILYIENKDINAKQGFIIQVADKFSEILSYFNSLKPKTIEEAEDALKE